MKNVLVTGCAGYVGGSVVDQLIKSNKYNIRGYDNLLYTDTYMQKIEFVNGDIRDEAKLKTQLDWADCVIHLAAIVGDAACSLYPKETVAINEKAVEFISKNFNGRIIFCSTCSVYGMQDGVLTEDSPANPLSLYAGTKYAAEKYLKGKNALIFRLGTLYGIGYRFGRCRFDLVVNVMSSDAFINKKLTVFGGEQYRPLLHVRDAAYMLIRAIEHDYIGVYNLASKNINISDLGQLVASRIKGCELETIDMKFEDSRNYQVDCSKAAQDISFDVEKAILIEEGVDEIVKILNEGRIKNPKNCIHSNEFFLGKLKYNGNK